TASQRPMQPTWAAIIEFEKPWEIPWDAIRFEDHPSLDWISRETSKPHRAASKPSSSSPEVWIIHANHRWSTENIECAPEVVAEQLLQALADLGLGTIPGTIGLQGHRWRYAQRGSEDAKANLEPRVLWDPESMVGACGDWVCDSPDTGSMGRSSGIERALESGAAMAGTILRHCISKFGPVNLKENEKPAFQPMLFGDEAF
ncbi:MAG: hypothetical protein ACKO9Q_29635, partial [Pirellula sp.]